MERESDMLEREIETYNNKVHELLGHAGKFVLIKDDKVEGIYDTYADGLRQAYEKHPQGAFLLKRIAPSEVVSFFTRDLPGCQVSP